MTQTLKRCLAGGMLLVLTASAISAGQPAPKAEESKSEGFPSLEALERDVDRLVEKTGRSVVGIVTLSRLDRLLSGLDGSIDLGNLEKLDHGGLARRVGSGIVLDSEGHIATLSSVVWGAVEITVIPKDGSRLRADIKGMDDDSGVAVLTVEKADSLRPIPFGDSGNLKVGSLVTAHGSTRGTSPVFSIGFVSGSGLRQGPTRHGSYLTLNAYTAPGAGGGPVLDSSGRMVGLVFGAGGTPGPDGPRPRHDKVLIWDTPQADQHDEDDSDDNTPAPQMRLLESLHRAGAGGSGVSYAVPGNIVKRITEQIIRTGEVSRGWIGFTYEETEPGDVRLLKVVPGSPAEKAGLKEGDRIVSINGEPLTLPIVQLDEARTSSPGTGVSLGIERAGRPIDMAIVLGSLPEQPRLAPRPIAGRRLLGVQVDDVDEDERQHLGGPPDAGMKVTLVYEGSRAAQAGLKPGDLIVAALGRPTRSVSDLRRALADQGADDEMEITIVRSRRTLVVKIPPPPAPPEPAATPPPPPPAPRPARAPRRPA